MAKNNKKDFAKGLPRAGSTFAVAMAVTMALSTQANAAEIDENALIGIKVPVEEPIVETTDAEATGLIVTPEANQAIEEENEAILAENETIADSNEQVEQNNDTAAENNEALTDGALADPGLDLPEAPTAPETEGLGEEDYNATVGEYNENVDGYNDAVDGYNEAVDGYNTEADAYDQQAQQQYEEDLKQYEEDKAARENTVQEYEEEKAQHEADTQAYQDYLDDLAKYEADLAQYNADLEKYNADSAQHAEDSQAYQDYLKAQAAYETALKQYEADLAQYNADSTQYTADSQAYQDYLKALEDYNTAKQQYDADLVQYNADSAQHAEDTQAYQDYLKALEDFNTAQAQYEKDYAQYELDSAKYTADSAEFQAYQAAKEAYDIAYQEYLAKMDQYKLDNAQYILDEQAYQDYLKAKAEYDIAKETYDRVYEDYVAEAAIYDEVTEYNQTITGKNETIQNQNTALENNLDAESVDSIGDVGENNTGVAVDQEILDVLAGYDTLKTAQAQLNDEAAALDNHAGKGADLGSDAYAEYLAAVEAFNDKVTQHNAKVDAYNAAVETYNEAVNSYNDSNVETSSTSADNHTETGTADWGNININNVRFSHIDVKYTAAIGKDKTVTVDADGKETVTYSDNMTQHTVTGVYTDEKAAEVHAEAKKDPKYNEARDGINYYGINYANNDSSEYQVHRVRLDTANNEFGNPNHSGAALDPAQGKISFHVTLVDQDGNTQGLDVKMDATTVYPEGTYYKAESNDFLDRFVGKDNKKLSTIEIDGVEYYDISGQSVFVISALTCDGMTSWGGWYGQEATLHTNGLDLVLNLQTLVKIHQSDNAKTVGYLGYELGKTAQATAPTDPGDGPDIPDVVADPGDAPVEPTAPTAPTLVADPGDAPIEPTAPTPPNVVENPGDAPTPPTAPDAPENVADPGDAPVAPIAPEAPEEVSDPGDAPTPPTAPVVPTEVPDPGDGPEDPGTFHNLGPEAPQPTARLEHAEKLTPLAEKVIAEVIPSDPETPDTPDVPDAPGGEEPGDLPEPSTPREVPPRAAAPKTGDLSGLWAAISGLSLGAMGLLNRKRKEEEA